MNRLNPEKLFVEYRGVTPTEPIIPRKYTLTHSDETGDLFLTIGTKYAYDKINEMRDEVLAEWQKRNDMYVLSVFVYVDGEFGKMMAPIRYKIFKRELPLALEAIRYGDRRFFDKNPELDDAPINIYFKSSNPKYNRIEYWGTPADYK